MQPDIGRDDAETRDPARDRAFLLLCAMGLLGRLSYEMLRTPVTALYARHLGAPVAMVGLLVSAVTVTGIFVKLPAGILADRLGARRVLGAGLAVKATAPFLYLLAATPAALLAVRLYHGLSTALYAPAASAEAAQSSPARRGRRLGFYGAAENMGVVLGPVLGAALLAHGGFALAFAVSGVIGILAFPASAGLSPRRGSASRGRRRRATASWQRSGRRSLRSCGTRRSASPAWSRRRSMPRSARCRRSFRCMPRAPAFPSGKQGWRLGGRVSRPSCCGPGWAPWATATGASG